MVNMASKCMSKNDNWQSILAEELMEKSTITPRTLSILKDDHDAYDPNVVMNLRHDKIAHAVPRKRRESLNIVMEEARRNLKAENHEKSSEAMHKRLLDSEVEKFKQHLAKLKRINTTSERIPHNRKPLRVRFQKLAMGTRSCGSTVVRTQRSEDPEFDSLKDVNLHSSNMNDSFLGISPPQLNWIQRSSSTESLHSDISLPTVYGNSICGSTEITQKGPNTTPVSFYKGKISRRDVGTKEENFSHEEEPKTDGFCAERLLTTEEHFHSKALTRNDPNENGFSDFNKKCDRGDFISIQHSNAEEIREEDKCVCNFDLTVIDKAQDDSTKMDNEKKRKVKNAAYKQFMSYVCNKSGRATQTKTTKLLPKVENEETASQRDEKIAMVLEYIQRKKNSPTSSSSVTPPEPVVKTKSKMPQTTSVSIDTKTVRASEGPFENRFQAQRDMIKRQKMQLEEQQKKIQELTLAKLQEEAKNSQTELKKIIDQVEDDCTLSIKPQLKTLKSAACVPDFSTAGKIVERMELRTKEREQKRQLAMERRKIQEEERKKRMKEEEVKRKKEEEDKKRAALEKIREENIRQREIRERTRKEQERMLELNRQADIHNRRRLCKIGFRAFRKLLIRRDQFLEKADIYYESRMLRTAFSMWKNWVDHKIEQKLAVAESFYNKHLLKYSFISWKKELADSIRKRQVADDMYELRLQERVFKRWSQYVNEQHLKMADTLATADRFYRGLLLRRAFARLRTYPKIAHLEREKELRKKVLRQKVQDMLPDFQPISEY